MMRALVSLTDRISQARLVREETGATAVEYALLVGLIAVVLIVGVGLFGGALNTFFNSLATWVSGIMP
jgi:pilus assembly protein Flp/PilA